MQIGTLNNMENGFEVDEEEHLCPLCLEEMDLTDRNFRPCQCGYQMCGFCWQHLQETLNAKCPACRTPYDPENFSFTPPPADQIAKMVAKKKKERSKKKAPGTETKQVVDRKVLGNVRVIQRNLVYITNLALSSAKEDILRRSDYFGKYGKIQKVVINTNNLYNVNSPGGPSVSAYVTYFRNQDALAAIKAVDGSWLGGRILRASFGTTKYCTYFLKQIPCTNPDCMYLHELGSDNDSFTKEEMSLSHFHNQIHPGAYSRSKKLSSSLPPPGIEDGTPIRVVLGVPPTASQTNGGGGGTATTTTQGGGRSPFSSSPPSPSISLPSPLSSSSPALSTYSPPTTAITSTASSYSSATMDPKGSSTKSPWKTLDPPVTTPVLAHIPDPSEWPVASTSPPHLPPLPSSSSASSSRPLAHSTQQQQQQQHTSASHPRLARSQEARPAVSALPPTASWASKKPAVQAANGNDDVMANETQKEKDNTTKDNDTTTQKACGNNGKKQKRNSGGGGGGKAVVVDATALVTDTQKTKLSPRAQQQQQQQQQSKKAKKESTKTQQQPPEADGGGGKAILPSPRNSSPPKNQLSVSPPSQTTTTQKKKKKKKKSTAETETEDESHNQVTASGGNNTNDDSAKGKRDNNEGTGEGTKKKNERASNNKTQEAVNETAQKQQQQTKKKKKEKQASGSAKDQKQSQQQQQQAAAIEENSGAGGKKKRRGKASEQEAKAEQEADESAIEQEETRGRKDKQAVKRQKEEKNTRALSSAWDIPSSSSVLRSQQQQRTSSSPSSNRLSESLSPSPTDHWGESMTNRAKSATAPSAWGQHASGRDDAPDDLDFDPWSELNLVDMAMPSDDSEEALDKTLLAIGAAEAKDAPPSTAEVSSNDPAENNNGPACAMRSWAEVVDNGSVPRERPRSRFGFVLSDAVDGAVTQETAEHQQQQRLQQQQQHLLLQQQRQQQQQQHTPQRHQSPSQEEELPHHQLPSDETQQHPSRQYNGVTPSTSAYADPSHAQQHERPPPTTGVNGYASPQHPRTAPTVKKDDEVIQKQQTLRALLPNVNISFSRVDSTSSDAWDFSKQSISPIFNPSSPWGPPSAPSPSAWPVHTLPNQQHSTSALSEALLRYPPSMRMQPPTGTNGGFTRSGPMGMPMGVPHGYPHGHLGAYMNMDEQQQQAMSGARRSPVPSGSGYHETTMMGFGYAPMKENHMQQHQTSSQNPWGVAPPLDPTFRPYPQTQMQGRVPPGFVPAGAHDA